MPSVGSIDEVDLRILKALKENSRKPYADIARELGLSKVLVKRRVDRLVKLGIVKKFTVVAEVGWMKAITLVSISPSIATSTIASKLLNIPEVEAIYEITGQYDVAVILSTPTRDKLNECIDSIRSIEGVASTLTMMVLKVWS